MQTEASIEVVRTSEATIAPKPVRMPFSERHPRAYDAIGIGFGALCACLLYTIMVSTAIALYLGSVGHYASMFKALAVLGAASLLIVVFCLLTDFKLALVK